MGTGPFTPLWVVLPLAALLCPTLGLLERPTPTPQVPQQSTYSTALEVPRVSLLHTPVTARALPDANGTDTAISDDGPRRRREQWDMVGPALLLGGTLALLVLAAVGHLASKALLASMLSAALSAVQLARQPAPNRPG